MKVSLKGQRYQKPLTTVQCVVKVKWQSSTKSPPLFSPLHLFAVRWHSTYLLSCINDNGLLTLRRETRNCSLPLLPSAPKKCCRVNNYDDNNNANKNKFYCKRVERKKTHTQKTQRAREREKATWKFISSCCSLYKFNCIVTKRKCLQYLQVVVWLALFSHSPRFDRQFFFLSVM